MRNGENPQGISSDDVRNVVGKNAQVDPSKLTRPQAIQLWMIRDPQDASIHFVFQSPSQARPDFLVVGNRIEKFVACFLDKTNDHGASRRSASRITSSYATPLTRPSSTARTRSRISDSQADSASGSGGKSVLSRRNSASASRWRGDSSMASFVISSSAFGMPKNPRGLATGQERVNGR